MIAPAQTESEPPLLFRYAIVAAICISAPPLLAILDFKWLGWLILGLVVLMLTAYRRSQFSRHMLILAGALALLGIVPINTDIGYNHMFIMGTVLLLTVAAPYFITSNILKEPIITFPFRFGRKWYRKEIAYVFLAGTVAYLFLPFYLTNTGSYLNWDAVPDFSHISRLFLGTNALGIWDEIFFVGVCLTLLRRHLPFLWANLAQALLWTTFLYELGFRGWGPIPIFLFALSQGYIFQRSKSLLYIITVHLTIDFVLFLVLVHLHNPEYLDIFVTSPF
jgi:membrane protease YdiL (CAAX protease family)